MAQGILNLTKENFESTVVRDDDTPVLVDFWAEWCGPCKMMNPILKELHTELGDDVLITKVNVDEQPELASAVRVQSIPTMLILRKGKVVDAIVGAQPKDVLKSKLTAKAAA